MIGLLFGFFMGGGLLNIVSRTVGTGFCQRNIRKKRPFTHPARCAWLKPGGHCGCGYAL